MTQFTKLFQRGFINHLEIKNRIIMAPIATNMASETGSITQRLMDFYLARAQGGVGAIILENVNVDYPTGKSGATQLRIDSIEFIPGLNSLVEYIKKFSEDTRMGIQINHAGGLTAPAKTGGVQPVAPSPVPPKEGMLNPRELEEGDIEAIINKFGNAALRAKQAGFDFVEIHGSHGYLIDQFLSPYTNKRKDAYGKDFEGRLKFPLEVIRNVRSKVDDDFPVLFRLGCNEFIEGGRTLTWAKQVARILQDEGIDALHVTAGTPRRQPTLTETFSYEQGWRVYLAEEIKKVVNIPVITVGVIREPQFAEDILQRGKADFVAMGRGLVADPTWPKKAKEGRVQEIDRCISCNICTRSRAFDNVPIRCTVNPEVGWEGMLEKLILPSKRRKIMVVGGGPAGMEAASVAASRGHEVSLYEKEAKLGGQLIICSVPPHKDKINWFTEYLKTQLKLKGVEVYLNTRVDIGLVKQKDPDAVIVATGSDPLIPDIPGIDGHQVMTAREVLEERKPIENERIVIVGGGQVSCETAEFLREKNNRVIIIEMLDEITSDAEPIYRNELVSKLIEDKDVEVLTSTEVVEIKENAVVTTKNDKKQTMKADRVVLAAGAKTVTDLVHELEAAKVSFELYVVGDARKPRSILEATDEGFWVASRL